MFNISINRATAVTRQYANSLPTGIASSSNYNTGSYVLALRNPSLHGNDPYLSDPDLYYTIGTVINREHFRPDNRKNLQGTASFWDSNVDEDGAPFQNIVKNTIKALKTSQLTLLY